MTYTKRLTVLAASRKHGGFCFAGTDEGGAWVRPVSARPDEEISNNESLLDAGVQAAVGDIVQVQMLRPKPAGYQSENHLIDPSARWSKLGTATSLEIERALSAHEEPLWPTQSSSGGYLNNRVAEQSLPSITSSLVLVRPRNLTLSIARKGGRFADADKRLVKAHFGYGGTDYVLAITDPQVDAAMRNGDDRTLDATGRVVCVSLGELHRGHAYKLVASVIDLP